MKATAIAPSNIAFIKFIGKTDDELRLPANSSVSMCLSAAQTITTVEVSEQYVQDIIEMEGELLGEHETRRIITHIDRIRRIAGSAERVKVVTRNTFPKSSGIASSASGFAALTAAAVTAFGLEQSERELSVLARLGSGSASRSIPDGFVEWVKGTDSNDSYAYSLYPPEYWKIADLIPVISSASKKVPTTDGHTQVRSSPFFTARIAGMETKIIQAKDALKRRDFEMFGRLAEDEALNMHAVMLTATPPLLYLQPESIEIIHAVWKWREGGLPVFFTIDAGPNIHILCEAHNKEEVLKRITSIQGVQQVIENFPAQGTRITDRHLF